MKRRVQRSVNISRKKTFTKKDEKKEKNEKERKFKKEMEIDNLPTDETLRKLQCVENAIFHELGICGEELFLKIQ